MKPVIPSTSRYHSLTAVEREVIDDLLDHPAKIGSLAQDGATDRELGAILRVPEAVVTELFAPALAEARARLACRIRRAILSASDKGDASAQSYLAKQYLGDRPKRGKR